MNKKNTEEKEKIIKKWVEVNGAATFDLKEREIILHDGGILSVDKKIKYRPRSRWKEQDNGFFKLVNIKGPKVRYEDYDCSLWFEELDETINYLRRMKAMLNGLGYRTNFKGGNKK